METATAGTYEVDYRIIDSTRPESERRVRVEVEASPGEVRGLVEDGFLVLDRLFEGAALDRLRSALDRVAEAELADPATEVLPENGHYLRSLMDKDPVFLELLHMTRPRSIARAVLGPQLWFDVEARIAPEGQAGHRVSWHIHHRVVPDPVPPFFCYPHAIHGLLYLDDVDDATGPICLLPGSHRLPALDIPAGDDTDREGQLVLPVEAGTCLLMHANLWHRTLPTTAGAKRRRLILFGYTPSWIRSEVARGVNVEERYTGPLRNGSDPAIRELLGEFYW